MWGEGALGELASAPLHPRLSDPVNALAFDPAEEALWAGTEGGLVCQLVCPSLDLYSSFPAHQVGWWVLPLSADPVTQGCELVCSRMDD